MIKFDDVCKCFEEQKKEVLCHLSFVLKDTGLVLVTGNSGVGKTTLLNLLNGIEKNTSGRIINECNSMGIVFQDANLFENLTVCENLNLYDNISPKEIDEILEKMQITALKDKKVSHLSGGEKRRISFARAILGNPDVLILDEPTASLDKENISIVKNVLENYAKTHLVIIAIHSATTFQYDMLIELFEDKTYRITGETYVKTKQDKKTGKKIKKEFLKQVSKSTKMNLSFGSVLHFFLLYILLILLFILSNFHTLDYSKIQMKMMKSENDNLLYLDDSKQEKTEDKLIQGKIFAKEGIPLRLEIFSGNIQWVYFGGNTQYIEFVPYSDDFMKEGLIGNKPQTLEELVIPEILAEHICYYGILESDGTLYKPRHIQDLLNQKIHLGEEEFSISGIMKQNTESYQSLKTLRIDSYERLSLKQDLLFTSYDSILKYCSMVFVSEEKLSLLENDYEEFKNFKATSFLFVHDISSSKSYLDKMIKRPTLMQIITNGKTLAIRGTSYSQVLSEILEKPYLLSLLYPYLLPIFFVLILILFFLYFFNQLIKNKRNIGIYLSLGLQKHDFHFLFFHSMIRYAMVLFFMTIILTKILFMGINSYLNAQCFFSLSPFTFSLSSCLFLIVLLLSIMGITYIFLNKSINRLNVARDIRNG